MLDRPVCLRGLQRSLRLLIAPLPEAPAAAARRRVRRRASKSGKAMLPNSERAAPYLMLVTSLDPARASTQEVLRLYRSRWQVELGFKRLKSLGRLDALPNFAPMGQRPPTGARAPTPGRSRTKADRTRRPRGSPAGARRGTMDAMEHLVSLGLDWQVPCGPGAVVLAGWMADPAGVVTAVRLRDGQGRASEPLDRAWLRLPRPDLMASVGAHHDLTDDRLGFLAAGDLGEGAVGPFHLEVTLRDGTVLARSLPPAGGAGLAAIRRVLGTPIPHDQLDAAFDAVLGPAVLALNHARLARPPVVEERRYGTPSAVPRCSVVIPLYGRLDFLDSQLALFSAGGLEEDEILYVLDQPERRTELLNLAHAAHERYGVPCRIVLPDANRGFGPACNIGLSLAAGRHVAFLNSDVFPAGTGWLDRLCADLDADPGLGAVGGLLLFADGSVQHDGMAIRPVADRAGWHFPLHPGKGLLPADGPALREVEAVTGALLVMRREGALSLGGFDERYLIGDFEDADLCARVRAAGLRCAVDRRAALYHLERQSQGSGDAMAWRHNVTLQNAWLYNRLWRAAA